MKILTRQQVRDALEAHGCFPFEGSLLADERYVLPPLQWLRNLFAPALQQFQSALALHEWSPEKNDCDNFAQGASFFASVLHRRMRQPANVELLFGEFWYVRQLGGAHAINFTLSEDASHHSGFRPVFFEPNGAIEITLSKKEVESCSGYRC